MTARTSPAEVRGLFRRVVAAAERAGVDSSGWMLFGGFGDPFGIHVRSGDHSLGEVVPMLGATAREAALALSAMERAYESVVAARVGA